MTESLALSGGGSVTLIVTPASEIRLVDPATGDRTPGTTADLLAGRAFREYEAEDEHGQTDLLDEIEVIPD